MDKQEFAKKCVEYNSEILACLELLQDEQLSEIISKSFSLVTDKDISKEIIKISNELGPTWSTRESEDHLRRVVTTSKNSSDVLSAIRELNKISNVEEASEKTDLLEMIEEVENNG